MAKKAAKKLHDPILDVMTHILGLLTGFLAPLIILLAEKDKMTKQHAREALNWQLSLIIYAVISVILMLAIITFIPGFLLAIALGLLNLIFCIKAAVRAEKGELWKYPLTIPFVS